MPSETTECRGLAGYATGCRICGYSPRELRVMVLPGECDTPQQWGKNPGHCYANSPDFVKEQRA